MSHRKCEWGQEEIARAVDSHACTTAIPRRAWWQTLVRAICSGATALGSQSTAQNRGWPRWSRALRVIFLSDFHTGSHSEDVTRLQGIVTEARNFGPDLVLFGGDFVNMQPFGGGRVPPRVVGSALARLDGSCGRF